MTTPMSKLLLPPSSQPCSSSSFFSSPLYLPRRAITAFPRGTGGWRRNGRSPPRYAPTEPILKHLALRQAGAAGLITQSALLTVSVSVYVAGGPVSQHGAALFAFLGLIMASRLGHMAYSIIGLQVVQTGNPPGKAKLIGATEIAVASLAELAMMTVAAVARDAAHFGYLAVLSAASVAAAAGLFCAWRANPSEELRRIFSR